MATNTTIPTALETTTSIVGEYIVSTPGVCNGEPRIAGTRIKVRHVYTWVEREGMSPAEVVEQHPHLSRAAVHAALAYYWSHQDEIQRAFEAEDRLVAELKAIAGPSLLSQKQAASEGANGSDDSISP